MAVIATAIEPGGIVRIFFDMRPISPDPQDEPRIAQAIEAGFALIAADPKGQVASPAA